MIAFMVVDDGSSNQDICFYATDGSDQGMPGLLSTGAFNLSLSSGFQSVVDPCVVDGDNVLFFCGEEYTASNTISTDLYLYTRSTGTYRNLTGTGTKTPPFTKVGNVAPGGYFLSRDGRDFYFFRGQYLSNNNLMNLVGVDFLNDFFDDVHDAAWAGDIDLTVSQPLIEAARGILPRRRVRTIDVPFSIGFPSRNGDGRLEVEWEERIYPADSALDHTTTSGELECIPWEGLTLDLAWERLVYPNASKKDRSRREWTLVATSTCSDWALTTTLSARSTVYPHVRAKDESVGKWELSLQGSIAGIDLALVGEDELTAHPNDATKPPTEMATIGLSATWTVENGTGKIELNEKTKEEQGNPISRMRAVELTWETSLTDEIDCSISANWNRTEDYTNATKDEAGFILKAEVSVPL